MALRTAEREGAFFARYLEPGMRVLDVGCGPGSISLGFAQIVAPAEVVGIDVEPGQVATAQALASERGVVNIRFEAGRAEALPYADGLFDAAFTHTLLEHVPDPLAVLREMRRVLKPDGLIGVRDGDVGGRLIFPPDQTMYEALALYERMWRLNGGNPEQGRRQRSLLREAGFDRLETSVGTNTFPLWAGEVFAEMLLAPRVSDRLIELDWTDRATIERYAAAFRHWGEEPDGIWSTMMVETVGRKPGQVG
jgi:ubiquinone/menaquinone biosynthesis C-methylase UbiE